jgi:hypothetical protein
MQLMFGATGDIAKNRAVTRNQPPPKPRADYTEVHRIAGRGQGRITGNTSDLTQAEQKMVTDLVNQGRNVEIIPRSNVPGVQTPDFLVDGIRVELKTLQGTSLNTPVTRITDGFR